MMVYPRIRWVASPILPNLGRQHSLIHLPQRQKARSMALQHRLCRPAKPGMLFRSLTNLQMLKNGPLTHLYSMRAAEDQNADVTAVALVCGLRSIHLIASSQNGGLLCLPLEAFN